MTAPDRPDEVFAQLMELHDSRIRTTDERILRVRTEMRAALVEALVAAIGKFEAIAAALHIQQEVRFARALIEVMGGTRQ